MSMSITLDSLPLEMSASAPILPERRQSWSCSSNVRAKRARVLVVDDEIAIGVLLEKILRAAFACEVDIAEHGLQALNLIECHAYDLIVSDIRMPIVDGAELFRRLAFSKPEMARRFVFVTGYAGDQAREEEVSTWGAPIITKPFKLSELTKVCAAFLAE